MSQIVVTPKCPKNFWKLQTWWWHWCRKLVFNSFFSIIKIYIWHVTDHFHKYLEHHVLNHANHPLHIRLSSFLSFFMSTFSPQNHCQWSWGRYLSRSGFSPTTTALHRTPALCRLWSPPPKTRRTSMVRVVQIELQEAGSSPVIESVFGRA